MHWKKLRFWHEKFLLEGIHKSCARKRCQTWWVIHFNFKHGSCQTLFVAGFSLSEIIGFSGKGKGWKKKSYFMIKENFGMQCLLLLKLFFFFFFIKEGKKVGFPIKKAKLKGQKSRHFTFMLLSVLSTSIKEPPSNHSHWGYMKSPPTVAALHGTTTITYTHKL